MPLRASESGGIGGREEDADADDADADDADAEADADADAEDADAEDADADADADDADDADKCAKTCVPMCSVYAGGIAWHNSSLVIHGHPSATRHSSVVPRLLVWAP